MFSSGPALLPPAQILKHLQEQKDSQCLHVEEYQNLVKDLRMELEAVSGQKKNIMKGNRWAGGLVGCGGGGRRARRKPEPTSEQEALSCSAADMMKLELDLHGLREETSAHIERKDKEIAILQRRLQELQMQFTETQKLGLKKDTVRQGAL